MNFFQIVLGLFKTSAFEPLHVARAKLNESKIENNNTCVKMENEMVIKHSLNN